MPTSTIPFDPSLVLGMVVAPNKIKDLQAIAELQKPVDAARNRVNALLRQKLSLDMTARELISLGAGEEQLKTFNENIATIMEEVIKATGDLSGAVISSESAIAQLKSEQGQKQISSQVQSPLDFEASQLKKLPISSDSMNMDVQYYRYETNEEETGSTANSISTFVGTKVTSFLGPSWGASAGASVHSAITSASKNRKLIGTVVICANCTHKQAQVFSPIKLDIEDAIENYVSYSGKAWDGDPEDPAEMLKMVNVPITPEDEAKGMPVLIGATYGSSFVGFVHFEQIEKTSSTQSAMSAATQASGTITEGLFLAKMEGSFGVDAETARTAKELMSSSDIQSHCSVITMGLIPSIKSNNIESVVEGLKPKTDEMSQLATMQDASNSGMQSMSSAASQAKKGQTIEKMSTDYIKGTVDAVGAIDTQQNKVIDMNSLMTAIDDFVKMAAKGDGGVPINFYLKYVTQRTIALQWMQKYYPDMLHEKKKAETTP